MSVRSLDQTSRPQRRLSDRVVALDAPQIQPFTPEPAADWPRRYVMALLGLDLLWASIAGGVALAARFGLDEPGTYGTRYRLVTLLFPFIWIGVLAAGRAYERRFLTAGSEEYRQVFDAAVRLIALTATLSYAFKAELARGYVMIALPLVGALTLVGRYVARQQIHRLRRNGSCLQKVIVIGDEGAVVELVRNMQRERHAGYRVVGACVTGELTGLAEVAGVRVLGTPRVILHALRVSGADTVAVAGSSVAGAALRRIGWELEGTGASILVSPSLTDVAGPRIHIRPVAGLPLLHVEEPEFGGVRRLVKNGCDRAAAGLALVLLSPLFAAIAVLIRTTTPGPAFFRQVRVGRDGQTFKIFKFRTMRLAAESELAALYTANHHADGPLFKIREDPRVTRVGAWLRAFSVDELPQLLNVVRGEMSIVGPRPPLPSEVEQYGHFVKRRLLVKPGITGLWQISGRADLPWDEAVRLDLHYVENWTPALDLMILWKTIAAVARRKGAY